jgi:hypothetical protein
MLPTAYSNSTKPGANKKKLKNDKQNCHKLKILKSDRIHSKPPLSGTEKYHN